MNQSSPPKKKVPWLLMALGLLIPIGVLGLALLAAKSDAENHRKYQQQKEEIAKRHAQNKAE